MNPLAFVGTTQILFLMMMRITFGIHEREDSKDDEEVKENNADENVPLHEETKFIVFHFCLSELYLESGMIATQQLIISIVIPSPFSVSRRPQCRGMDVVVKLTLASGAMANFTITCSSCM
jgi:hypothetical protein